MSEQPLVSVVIPTRNRAGMLQRCLGALAEQTYPALEVIVVDDASTDATPEMLQAFANEHPDLALTVLRNSPQRGANPSRNRAIEASRGAFVAFEDDDCIAEATWVSELMKGFESERVGAVTGMVEDPDPRNIYDLAFRGTHRVYGRVQATRLVVGNACVRKPLLTGALDEDRSAASADMSVSGRGDEEDLYLKLKANGYEVRVAHAARVLHVHYYTRASFFRQALRGGASAARVGYKYYRPLRPELVCLAAGYLWLLGGLLSPWSLVASAVSFGLFAAATLVYNEVWRKGKTWSQAVAIAPIMTAYYHVRALGYFRQLARLWLGFERLERVRLTPAPR